jgi:hypothetical protein
MFRVVLTGLLLSLATIHGYWARGGTWPGSDSPTLLEKVVGLRTRAGEQGRVLAPWTCWLVALLFAIDAVLVVLYPWILHPNLRLAYWMSAGVFLLRGLLGYSPLFEYARATPFYNLNRRLYSPLCLFMAWLHWLAR